MNLTGVIAISGKPGLFKVVAKGKNNIIVESLIDGKKAPAYSTDRISALEDISIYTYEEDVPLKEVFEKIYDKEDGKNCISHKESLNKLKSYLEEILPDYDEDRVYPSDIKKLFQWYNLLNKSGLTSQEEEEEVKEDANEETKEATKPEKKKEVTKKAEKKPEKKKETPKKASKEPKKETKKAPKKDTKKVTKKESSK